MGVVERKKQLTRPVRETCRNDLSKRGLVRLNYCVDNKGFTRAQIKAKNHSWVFSFLCSYLGWRQREGPRPTDILDEDHSINSAKKTGGNHRFKWYKESNELGLGDIYDCGSCSWRGH